MDVVPSAPRDRQRDARGDPLCGTVGYGAACVLTEMANTGRGYRGVAPPIHSVRRRRIGHAFCGQAPPMPRLAFLNDAGGCLSLLTAYG